MSLRAPFPWFGGKRRVAHLVWSRFGQVHTYNEPFAGSLAVLLGRPHAARVETVNDLDCFVCNFWRALQADPDAVAYYADWPVNEADLHSRHRWLIDHRPLRCSTDPTFYDARIAGWWVWGLCLWIGGEWCMSKPLVQLEHRRPKVTKDAGVHRKRPAASRDGESVGVHLKRFVGPGNGQGTGVHSQRSTGRRWQGGGQGGGSGVHAPSLSQQKPDLTGDYGASGRGVHNMAMSHGLYTYMRQLAERLRRVRVCCGDWPRVLTPSVTTYVGTCAVFLDPPYRQDLRERCYSEDHDVAKDVRLWALERADDPLMRIALCGYEGEHDMPASWECVAWKAHGGYSRTARGVANRDRERIWFSPYCLRPSDKFAFEGESE